MISLTTCKGATGCQNETNFFSALVRKLLFSHRGVAALSAVMEGALFVRDVRDHRVCSAVHQNFRDLAVHVLQSAL